MRKLTLAEADTIIDAALAKGRELDLGRLAVVVLDDGGHPIAMKREDGSEFLRPQIASAKAWGALGMGLPSRLLHERAKKLPDFIGASPTFLGAAWWHYPEASSSETPTALSWERSACRAMFPSRMRYVRWRESRRLDYRPTSDKTRIGAAQHSGSR